MFSMVLGCLGISMSVQQILRYALVNLNRKFEYLRGRQRSKQCGAARTHICDGALRRYVAGLDAHQRADLAVCHIYIAQAILYDEFALMSVFCSEVSRGCTVYGAVLGPTKLHDDRVGFKQI